MRPATLRIGYVVQSLAAQRRQFCRRRDLVVDHGTTCADAARILVNKSWRNTKDRTARTAPGRAAFIARFERQADPDGVMDPEERAAVAYQLKRAFFRQKYQELLARRAGGEV